MRHEWEKNAHNLFNFLEEKGASNLIYSELYRKIAGLIVPHRIPSSFLCCFSSLEDRILS